MNKLDDQHAIDPELVSALRSIEQADAARWIDRHSEWLLINLARAMAQIEKASGRAASAEEKQQVLRLYAGVNTAVQFVTGSARAEDPWA